MAESVLFVHGTGVRGVAYAKTLRQVAAGLAGTGVGVPLNGCFWGEAAGARLQAGGASVPTYPDTGGGGPSEAERDLALWSVLHTDPLYELRLLAEAPGPVELSPGAVPPSARLRDLAGGYEPGGELGAAVRAVRDSAEFHAAAGTARHGDLEHVRAFARAVVAHTAVAAAEAGEPALSGAQRDALVERVVGDLGGHGRGVGDWLGRVVKGLAARLATGRLTRRRGDLTDASVFAAGDILRYQARGADVRAVIRRAVEAAGGSGVTLLAHSLGGVACVDLLVGEEIPGVTRLVTVGSQAPFLYEIGALTSLEFPAPLPAHFPPWLNVYDRRDLLSYVGAPLFGDRVRDVEVDNGQPFPAAHSAYWHNPATWSAVAGFLTG